jgi:hypothetical protein
LGGATLEGAGAARAEVLFGGTRFAPERHAIDDAIDDAIDAAIDAAITLPGESAPWRWGATSGRYQ